MTDNTSRFGSIRIPTPLVIVIVTVMLALFSWTATEATNHASDHTQIQVNTKVLNDEVKPDIQKLKDTKADKVDLERIYDALIRIEGKLDSHIEKK